MTVEKKLIANKVWFSAVSLILILAGIAFAFLGLGILPVQTDVLLQWESAIYGAIMMGWGTTLFLAGRLAFQRNDPDLMKPNRCCMGLPSGLLSRLCFQLILVSGSMSAWMPRSLCCSAFP